jgi:hypothetical protein
MITLFEKFESKLKLGVFVSLSDDIQSLINPWIYPVGEIIEINFDSYEIKVKTYPVTNEKRYKVVKIYVKQNNITNVIKKENIQEYIDNWLHRLNMYKQAKKYNI